MHASAGCSSQINAAQQYNLATTDEIVKCDHSVKAGFILSRCRMILIQIEFLNEILKLIKTAQMILTPLRNTFS